jgi:hypothetical protein
LLWLGILFLGSVQSVMADEVVDHHDGQKTAAIKKKSRHHHQGVKKTAVLHNVVGQQGSRAPRRPLM